MDPFKIKNKYILSNSKREESRHSQIKSKQNQNSTVRKLNGCHLRTTHELLEIMWPVHFCFFKSASVVKAAYCTGSGQFHFIAVAILRYLYLSYARLTLL